jgi:hypothetical protein
MRPHTTKICSHTCLEHINNTDEKRCYTHLPSRFHAVVLHIFLQMSNITVDIYFPMIHKIEHDTSSRNNDQEVASAILQKLLTEVMDIRAEIKSITSDVRSMTQTVQLLELPSAGRHRPPLPQASAHESKFPETFFPNYIQETIDRIAKSDRYWYKHFRHKP